MRILNNKLITAGAVAFIVVGTFMISSQNVVQSQNPGGQTVILSERSYMVNGTDSAANPSLNQLDVSGMKTIRINFRSGICASCSPVRVEVLSNATQIDSFNIDVNVNASRVYEVPGTELTLKFANTMGSASNAVFVTVLGRNN